MKFTIVPSELLKYPFASPFRGFGKSAGKSSGSPFDKVSSDEFDFISPALFCDDCIWLFCFAPGSFFPQAANKRGVKIKM